MQKLKLKKIRFIEYLLVYKIKKLLKLTIVKNNRFN